MSNCGLILGAPQAGGFGPPIGPCGAVRRSAALVRCVCGGAPKGAQGSILMRVLT